MPKRPDDTDKKQVHVAPKTGFERPARPGGAKRGPAGRRAVPKKGPVALTRQHKVILGVAAGGLAVLLAVLLTVALAPAPAGLPAASRPAAPPTGGIDAASLPGRLDSTQYIGTLLPESADAGPEYCEETLFLGDSNTERMMYYSDVTGVRLENCIGVASMGITTFTTNKCVQFRGHSKSYTMPEAVGILQPRRVVITFGTNNAGLGIDTFTGYYRDALDAIKKEYPDCDIIIGAVFPVDQYRQNTAITMASIDKMNVALAALAKQEDVKFLNWYEALLDEATGYSGFEYTLQDGVHLTRAGMEAIFTYFRTHAYITEDTRPALKAIPKRIGIQPGVVTSDPYKIPGPIDWSQYEDDSASSSAAETVRVTFTAYDQTNKKAGGGTFGGAGSGGSFTLSLKPGAGAGQVTATPASGYEFVGWSASAGSTVGASGASISYTVPADAEPGSAITVTALFRVKQASSSSAAPSASESQPAAPSQPAESLPASSSESPGAGAPSEGPDQPVEGGASTAGAGVASVI